MKEEKDMKEEISTVDELWQMKIRAAASGMQVTPRENHHRVGPTMPWEVYSLLFGIFWIALPLFSEGDLAPRIFIMIVVGGPFIALFVWRTYFHTRLWIVDIRLFERDGQPMARFVQMNGYDLICPVEAVLEMRNRVNAYDFVFSDGKRVRLPRPTGEIYDIRHFPNCRYKQG